MGLDCNWLPIIKVKKGNEVIEEESILFKVISTNYTRNYPNLKGKDLRRAITDAYTRFKSTEFKRMFGDWMLLKRLETNTATQQDYNVFSSVYNNDLTSLKNSISITLNEQGEPDFKAFEALTNKETSKTFLMESSKYPFLKDSEQAYINRIISGITIRIMPQIEDRTYIDFKQGDKIRHIIAKALRKYAESSDENKGYKSYMELANEVKERLKANNYTDEMIENNAEFRMYFDKAMNLIQLADDIDNLDQQHIWKSFVQYFRVVFYGDINDTDIEDSMTMGELNEATITYEDNQISKTWDSTKQFTKNYKETTSNRFKRFLTTMIYSNESNMMNPNYESASATGTASYYNKYGLVMPFDIDMIWNDLIQLASNVSTRDDLIRGIQMLSESVYNNQLDPLIDEFKLNGENDPDAERKNIFYNMLIKAIDLSVPVVTNTKTKKYNVTKAGYDLSYTTSQSNRESFAINVVYDKYRRILTNIIQHSRKSDFNVPTKAIKTIDDRLNNIITHASVLGLNWNRNILIYYIADTCNMSIDTVRDIITNSDLSNLNSNINDVISDIEFNILNFKRTIGEVLSNDIKDTRRQAILASKLLNGQFYITENGNLVSQDQILNISSPVEDFKGYIYKLAKVGMYDIKNKIDLGYINVHGQQEYTPEFHNFITSMMQGLVNGSGTVNVDIVITRFKDYVSSPTMKYNPLIWNLDGNGFFNRAKDEHGDYVLDSKDNWVVDKTNPINKEAVKNFTVSRFGGIIDEDSNNGLDYTEMHDYMWTQDVLLRQFQNRYSLPSADASRIYEFTINGRLNRDKIFDYIVLRMDFFKNGHVSNAATLLAKRIENNELYELVKNTLYSEFQAMRMARDLLFNYDPVTKKLSIKSQYLRSRTEVRAEFDNLAINEKKVYYPNDTTTDDKAFTAYYNSHNIDINKFKGLPAPMFWDGKTGLLDKNGNPTGAIFKLGNLNFRYYDDQGRVEVRDITHYINIALAYSDDLTTLEHKPSEFGSKPEPYMLCNLNDNYVDYLEYTNKQLIDKAFVLFFRDRLESHLMDAYDLFNPIRNRLQSTLTYKNIIAKSTRYISDNVNDVYKNLPEPSVYKDDQHWAYVLSNAMLDHYINDVAIQEVFTGFTYEFKNALDWAKRCNQNSRIGAKSRSESTYRQIVVEDVWLKDNMLDLIAPFKEHRTQAEHDLAETIHERFKGLVESANGFNIITEEECIRRFKETGDYYDFELPSGNTLQQLIEGNMPIDSRDYARIVQQLKYYYFNRSIPKINNPVVEDFILSHQDKNSTLVIFKNMYKGTIYETLAGWMSQESIHSINFVSGHKVGGMPAVKLFDVSKDGSEAKFNITVDENTGKYVLKDYPNGVEEYVHVLNHSNLFTQQTIPSHLVDEEIKIGTQLQKRILDNLVFDGEYNISGIARVGKNGNYNYNSAGVFEHYQNLLVSLIADAKYKLLSDWGALDNKGNIKYKKTANPDDQQLIEVNVDLMIEDLQEYMSRSEIDRNILKAIVVTDGKPFLPFYHPTIKTKIESVLLARITKRITNLKTKGAHVTIQPDTFLRPANSVKYGKNNIVVGTQDNVTRLMKEGNITFSDDYWKERCELDENGNIIKNEDGSYKIKKDADFALKSEYIDKDGVFHPAEIILNRWDSRFKLNKKGLLDLNTIPENLRTMFGIRIPTEGHQSMFVAKVVGVLNNDASQTIVPLHLMLRTGWDFDIDSIYLYIKDFDIINNKYVEYTIDRKGYTRKQEYQHIIDTYLATEYNNIRKKYTNLKLAKYDEITAIRIKIDELRGINSDPVLKEMQQQLKILIDNRFKSTDIKERAAYAKKIDVIQKQIFDYEKEHSINENVEDPNKTIATLIKRKKLAYKELKQIDANYKNTQKQFIKDKVVPIHKQLDRYAKATTQAKNNALIDVFIGIHSDPKNLLNKEKNNSDFGESVEAADYVNTIFGISNNTMNQHFLVDQIRIRNINNGIAVNKGASVSMDNTLSVFGITQTQLIDELAIPIRLKYSDIKGYSDAINKSMFVRRQIEKIFDNDTILGDKKVIRYNDANEEVIIYCRKIYNNDKGTWTDINGQKISEQRSQLTSHILDAVKQNMGHNSNSYTISNTGLLSAFPVSWNVNLRYGDKTVTGVNRFIYPVLIESQKVIVDLVRDISIKQIESITNYTNISFNNVRANYVIDTIFALARANNKMKNKATFKQFASEYIKENKSNKAFKDFLDKILKSLKEDIDIRDAHTKLGIRLYPRQIRKAIKFLSVFMQEINGYTYDINSSIETKAKTIEDLDNILKQGQRYKYNKPSDEEYAIYLVNQLEILDYYEHCDKAVNAMKRAQGVLVTEKRGAGPKIVDNNKLIESIAELEYNLRKFKEECKNKGIPKYLIDDVEYKYYQEQNIPKRREIIDNAVDEFNEIIKNRNKKYKDRDLIEKPKCPFNIGKQSLIDAIFPSITKKEWDITDSAYPLFQEQLISTNVLTTQLFSELLISENPTFKAKLNYIMSKLGRPNDAALKESVINYALLQNVITLPFFNTNDASQQYVGHNDLDVRYRANILGSITLKRDYDENHNLIPVYDGTSSNIDLSMLTKKLEDLKELFDDSLKAHKETLDKFKKFPLAIQIALVRNTMQEKITSYPDAMNPNHILNLIYSNSNIEAIFKYDYLRLYTKTSTDIDYTRTTLDNMINSTDDYIRIVGENIVRYSFWINGFKFGKNTSNYIPTDMYGQYTLNDGSKVSAYKTKYDRELKDIDFTSLDGTPNETMREIKVPANNSKEFRSDKTALYHYSEYLYNMDGSILNKSLKDVDEFIEAFIRANATNSNIVKKMQIEYDNINGKTTIKENTPSYTTMSKAHLSRILLNRRNDASLVLELNEWSNEVDSSITNYIDEEVNKLAVLQNYDIWHAINQVIIEPIEFIENSATPNEMFLTKDEKLIKGQIKGVGKKASVYAQKGILYKRVDISGCAVYYPISRTLPMEYMNTCIDVYKFGIEDETLYQNIGKILAPFVKGSNPQVDSVVNTKNKSEAILTTISNVLGDNLTGDKNAILYITISNNPLDLKQANVNTDIYGDDIVTVSLKDLLNQDKPFVWNDLFKDKEIIPKLGIIGEFKSTSQISNIINQRKLNEVLNGLIKSRNINEIVAVQSKSTTINDMIVNFIGVNDNINSTVNTINSIDIKFSTVIDTDFIEDPTDSSNLDTSTYMYMHKLFEAEKNAIINTKAFRNEINILGTNSLDLDKLVNEVKAQIENLTEDINLINNYEDTLKFNINVLNQIYDLINTINFNYTTADIVELFKPHMKREKQMFLIKLNKLNAIVKSQEYINNIDYLSDKIVTNTSDELKASIGRFNDLLKVLKDIHAPMNDLKTIIDTAIEEYFAILIINRSKNPYFKTKYKYIADSLAENDFDIEAIDSHTISSKDIADTIRKMLLDNLDLSTAIKWLDSGAQTGIPLIDNVMRSYEGHVTESETWSREMDKVMSNIYEKYSQYFITTSKGKLNTKHITLRDQAFKAKFIDEDSSQLIAPFNRYEYSKYAKLQKAIYIDLMIEKQKELKSIYDNQVNSVNRSTKLTNKQKASLINKYKKQYVNDYKNYKIKTLREYQDILTSFKSPINISIPIKDGVLDIDAALNDDATRNAYKVNKKEWYYLVKTIELIWSKPTFRNRYFTVNGMKVNSKKSTNNRLVITTNIYNGTKNKKFDNLSNDDIDFLLEIGSAFMDINDTIMPNSPKPITFFPYFVKSDAKAKFKQFIGYKDLTQDDYIVNMAGETQYYLKASAANKPRLYGLFNPKYDDIEVTNDILATLDNQNNIAEYESTIANYNSIAKSKGYKKEIKTIQDVMEYNDSIYEERSKKLNEYMGFDPVNAMAAYIQQAKRIRTNNEFRPELLALQSLLGSDKFKARSKIYKSDNVVNKMLSAITRKTEVVHDTGKDTDAYQRLKTFIDNFEGKNRINTTVDQILNVLHNINSKSLMWLNVTGALKNIGTGHINIVSEAFGGEFTTKEALHKAHALYFNNLFSLIGSLGEIESDNITTALIKAAGSIFEDQSDAEADLNLDPIATGINKWNNAMYFLNSAGEHYLQYCTYLAALQTHKIVGGMIMNFEQFSRSIREKVLLDMLDDKQKKEYEDYKAKHQKHSGTNITFTDYITNFITYKRNNFSNDFKHEYARKYKEAKAKAKEEFNKLTSVYDAFELVDGMAKIKDDSGLTQETFSDFLGTVKGVNHSLHGIYNTFDKSALAGTMYGEVVLQFRKWVRPNFIRYFGKRIGTTMFDERLGAYRSGAYTSLLDFIFHNATQRYRDTINEVREKGDKEGLLVKMKAIFNMMIGITALHKDMSFRYSILPEHEKANIRRALTNFFTLVLLTTAAAIVYGLAEDDDELDDNHIYALFTYFIYGVQTELYESADIYAFYKRTTENPIPFENTIGNWGNLLYWTLIAPIIEDEEDLVYDRGSLKDENKALHHLKRSIPLWNQYNKLYHLPHNDTYYMRQNPLLKLITKLND